MPTLQDARSAYAAAARAFLDLVATIPLDRYDGPGLGDWDLRALVGHTGRSFTTVTTYLATRTDAVAARSPGEYFAVVDRLFEGRGAEITRRGVAAGRELGDDPVAVLRAAWSAADEALGRLDGKDPVVDTVVGGMRVSDYLPTRTFELTVHALDVARAVDHELRPPHEALAATLAVATESALLLGHGVDVTLALTGRRPLPPGLSVVP